MVCNKYHIMYYYSLCTYIYIYIYRERERCSIFPMAESCRDAERRALLHPGGPEVVARLQTLLSLVVLLLLALLLLLVLVLLVLVVCIIVIIVIIIMIIMMIMINDIIIISIVIIWLSCIHADRKLPLTCRFVNMYRNIGCSLCKSALYVVQRKPT